MDGLKSEEETDNYKKAQNWWEDKGTKRPGFKENSRGDDLQKEVEWIQRIFVNHLNRCCKKVKVCGRSKRCWTVDITENIKILGSLKRSRKKGEAMQQQVEMQLSNLQLIIRQSKKKMWPKLIHSATRGPVWQALGYTELGGQQTTKAS